MVALPPRLGRAEAEVRLRGGVLRRWLGTPRGPLVAVLYVHLPYRLFRVTVRDRGREQVSFMALDAVTGQLDPYRFDAPPEPASECASESADVLAARVPVEALRARLLELVRREVFLRGFFRLAEPELTADDMGRELRVPHWVGIYAQGERITVEVWNAVRCRPEGAKVREIVEAWLARRG